MPETVIGREQELGATAAFVNASAEQPAVLVLRGEAGIGKTTLWLAAAAEARQRGMRVLVARPGEAETGLAFAGLADLLGDALDLVVEELPAPQRRALRVALLLEEVEGPPPEERSVAAAVVSVLRRLAALGPLLIAVDDVQWLDAASTRALAFAVRRLAGNTVSVLLAQRVGVGDELPLGLARAPADLAVDVLPVGPLSLGALSAILRRHTGTALTRPVLRRLHEVSAGNPFFALEFARALDPGEPWDPAGPLPVPATLQELVRARLAGLAAATVTLLPMLAAQPNATIGRLQAAGATNVDAGLTAAIEAGVVRRDGERVRFTHPLLASAAYAGLTPEERRALHRRLADAAEGPEERGHHLAFATGSPSRGVALRLDDAADHALRRGAIPAAADFHAHARRLTPAGDREIAHRRAAAEAECRLLLGENVRARHILEQVLSQCSPGAERAPVLYQLGRVEAWGMDWRRSLVLLQGALDEVDDDALRARIEVQTAMTSDLVGDARAVRDHARNAAALAERLGDRPMLAEALALQARAAAIMGEPDVEPLIERALALEPATAERSPQDRPSDYVAIIRGWRDELPAAIAALRAVEAESVERGEETSVAWTLARIIPFLCASGAWRQALEDAERGYELAVATAQPANQAVLLAGRALVEAHLGREDHVRRTAEAALELAGRSGAVMAERMALAALGLLELSLKRPEAARSHLQPLVAATRAAGVGEPGAMRFVTDAVEALTELGRLEDARELLDWFEGRAQALGRGSALASAARCRGLLASATGDAKGALELLTVAAEGHARAALPFDSARTLLALGATRRRLRQKRASREALAEALAAFGHLGAALWAERARAELGSISGRAPGDGHLTPAESRVAELVGRGHTNREVAATLFLSERTVEAHLSRVYAKLRVRSRTELARHMAVQAGETRRLP